VQIDLIIRKEGDQQPYTVICDLAERLVFGRGIASPVLLEGSEISREHFAVFSRQGVVYMEDLSSNGTRINGSAISSAKPRRLLDGDIISIPGYELELERHAPPPSEPTLSSAPVAPPLPKAISTDSAPLLTAWEMMVIAAALASIVLIVYYIAR
jgi:pSer/pThr/pTyr-binding forkhead associated (FHA) protein